MKHKARDVTAIIILWIGAGLVTWGAETSKVVGVVLITLLGIYYTGGVYLRSDLIKKEER